MNIVKQAIIVFVRKPELGKVKTRLAKTIGSEAALKVYTNLLIHTKGAIVNLPCDKFIFYTDAVDENDIWENTIFNKRSQIGNNLGERMSHAFNLLFDKGYSKVIIVGSDCPGLNQQIIEQSFNALQEHDVVLGPTYDGGYFLLGLKFFIKNIFENINWSTPQVFSQTIKAIDTSKKTIYLLDTLSDIDTEADLLPYPHLT